jgi:hypothetical protein
MKTKNSLLLALGLFSLAAATMNAQIAINNSATNPNASAVLDLKTGNGKVYKGFLPNEVNLTSTSSALPVTSPDTGLIVYSSTAPTGGNGAGYYYWTGSTWASLGASSSSLSGSGTNNYVTRWTPNGSTLGIGIIQDNGSTVGVNHAPVADSMFYVNSASGVGICSRSSVDYGIYGFSASASNAGVEGEDDNNVGVFGLSNQGTGVLGYSNFNTGFGVLGNNASAIGVGVGAVGDTAITAYGTWDGLNVYALNNAAINAISGYLGISDSGAAGMSVVGTSSQGLYAQGATYGVYGTSLNASYYGVYGEDDNNVGVEGFSVHQTGVYAYGGTLGGSFNDANGDVVSLADNPIGYGVNSYGTGRGGDFTDQSGDYAYLADNATNTALILYGITNAVNFQDGVGDYGYLGYSSSQAGGYFHDNGTDYSYIAYNGYGILSNGTKSTMVKDENNQERVLFCNESPEVMFEDYGEGQLVNGKAHITLDGLYAKHVAINEKHPLRVFIQLEDNENCKGVVTKNKTATGFDVVELNGGVSNTPFEWHIICNRANEEGKYRQYADERFPVGPGPAEKSPIDANRHSSKAHVKQAAPDGSGIIKGNNPNKGTKRVTTPQRMNPVNAQFRGMMN